MLGSAFKPHQCLSEAQACPAYFTALPEPAMLLTLMYGRKRLHCVSMCAQPLYAPDVKISDHTYRNLVIIATEFNSVYAFDAGAAPHRPLNLQRRVLACPTWLIKCTSTLPADTREQLWKTSLTVGRVVTAIDIPAVPSRPGGPCTDISPYYGAQPAPER